MLTEREVLRQVLNCGNAEIEALLLTNIDVGRTARKLRKYSIAVTYNNLMFGACNQCIREICQSKDTDMDDFRIHCNGIDTDVYIINGKYQYYRERYRKELESAEKYLNLKFEDGDC